MSGRVVFRSRWLPWLLVAPQVLVTLVFFLWPAGEAILQSTQLPDPFGLSTEFVGSENFSYLFGDRYYRASFLTTAIFSVSVTVLSMSVALFLAVLADGVIRGSSVYRTLLLWPYAVAPAVAGVMWLFMFQPSIGLFPYWLKQLGYNWNHVLNPGEAMSLVVVASSWKQVSYNFLFFLAGLQAIPKSLIEAAAIDGASALHRFRTIILPLLSPTTFFLLVINIIYAFFETFGVIDTITRGGPGQSTMIMVYKVYADGFVGQDLGSSAAQSVVLMAIVGVLTVVQFRFVERRVHY